MIKRILKIAQAELNALVRKNKFFENHVSSDETINFHGQSEYKDTFSPSDPLAKYYANLEIPVGSNQKIIKTFIVLIRTKNMLLRTLHAN
jgi:hypothetical protein